MTALIEPKPLPVGGTIAIVAPSGPMKELGLLAEIVLLLEGWGYTVRVEGSCFTQCSDYLAGDSDEHRAVDMMNMFADESVDAILCMRGGYGSNCLIPYFQSAGFDFASFPKPFVGYSDITYLHTFLNQKHGLMTYHGPMVKELLAGNEDTIQSFKRAMAGKNEFILNKIAFYRRTPKLVSGTLTGGNLTMVCTTLGTDCEIDTTDKILFLEEVDEPLYSIDRLLMQLFNSGKLQVAKGIILGDFNVEDRPGTHALLKKMLFPLNIPIAHHVDSGHCQPLITLPLGAWVTLNPSGKQIIFESPR